MESNLIAKVGVACKLFFCHKFHLILTNLSFEVEKILKHEKRKDVIAIPNLAVVAFMTHIFTGQSVVSG